jgi:hypothetical protein
VGTGGVLRGGDRPVRLEVLLGNERTRVTRLPVSGRTVIRKEPLGARRAAAAAA